MWLELNCFEQARVGVPRERVTLPDILIPTMRYRRGLGKHYLPGAAERIADRVRRSGIGQAHLPMHVIDFIEAAILDEEAAAAMAIDHVESTGWPDWQRSLAQAEDCVA